MFFFSLLVEWEINKAEERKDRVFLLRIFCVFGSVGDVKITIQRKLFIN